MADPSARSSRPTIVFVTQVVDPDDPVLGFVLRQVRELAARDVDVVVVANEVRRVVDLGGAELITLGKESGAGRVRRFARFVRTVERVARERPPVTIVAHMCPIYLVAAALPARVRRARLVLWFAHPRNSWLLGLADLLADDVITSLPGAYPRPSRKVRVIGQAIDTTLFTSEPPCSGAGLRLLALGRTSPNKGYGVMFEAVRRVREGGHDVRLTVRGPATTDEEREHKATLVRLVGDLGLTGAVTVAEPVPHDAVPGELRTADALLNASIDGHADKAVFEAMASGRPVLVASAGFRELLAELPLNLTFAAGSADELTDRLLALASASAGTRARVGAALRARIEQHHSIGHWADAVAAIAAGSSAGE
jgi:glycosyltransferase involved in cell wall biosynthesis